MGTMSFEHPEYGSSFGSAAKKTTKNELKQYF